MNLIRNYRLYQIDISGEITGVPTDYNFIDDGAAMDAAGSLTLSDGVEIWKKGRLVGRVHQCLPRVIPPNRK